MIKKLEKLKIYLSEDRLKRYYELANCNLKKAILLYQKDLKYCQKLYIALNLFEIILRNAINTQLTDDLKINWLFDKKLNFSPIQLEVINEAKFKIIKEKKKINNSNMITKLTFGFWCSLFDGRHDKILWRVSLYKIFKNAEKISLKRSKIRDYLQKLRRMRNRISHCECIIQYPVEKYYNNLIEFLDWIDGDIAEWVKNEVNF